MCDDIVKRLRTKATLIYLGEKIAFGSDVDLMLEAADCIEKYQTELIKSAYDVLEGCGLDCRLDHDGNCQEHFLESDCSVARLKQALSQWMALPQQLEAKE